MNTPEKPLRVQTALQVIDSCQNYLRPWHCECAHKHELSPKERATYESALSVLQLYLTGEMDYADPPVTAEPAKEAPAPGTAPGEDT